MIYLTLAELLHVAERALGGEPLVRDQGLLQSALAVLTLVALVLGIVLGLVFLVATAAGGAVGASLSDLAAELRDWGIRIAAAAVLFGLVHIYVTRTHTLTVGSEGAPDA